MSDPQDEITEVDKPKGLVIPEGFPLEVVEFLEWAAQEEELRLCKEYFFGFAPCEDIAEVFANYSAFLKQKAETQANAKTDGNTEPNPEGG